MGSRIIIGPGFLFIGCLQARTAAARPLGKSGGAGRFGAIADNRPDLGRPLLNKEFSMRKKSLWPALSLSILALTAPLPAWAQEESDPSANTNMTLDTLVVTASRTAESMREVTSNVTVITEEQIRMSTAKSMDQLLAQQGLQVTNQGTSKLLKIRGIGQASMATEMQSGVLILLNGRRLGSNNIGALGLANVERVEIIRGPSAVQYGSAAMGGVVNIITRRGQDGFKGSAEIGFGSFGLDKQEVALSGGAGRVDFSAAYTRTSRDDYEVKGGHKWDHTSYGSLTNADVDLGFSFLDKHRIGVNVYHSDLKDAYSAKKGWSGSGAIGLNSDFNWYEYRNTNLSFSYEGATDDDRFNWMFNFSDGKDEQTNRSYTDYIADSWDPDNYTLKNKGMTVQGGYNGEKMSLSIGFDYLMNDIDGNFEGNALYKNYAGFISTKFRFFDDSLILSAGGRYDKFSLNNSDGGEEFNETNFSPSIGLAYLPVDWLKLRANYSKGFRMPSPKESVGGGPYYAANLSLKPEKSETFEAGADLTWKFITTSVTYFHSDYDNKIFYDGSTYNPITGKSQFNNMKSSELAGVEFSFSANLGQAFDWECNLTPYVNLTRMTTRKNKDPNRDLDTFLQVPDLQIAYGLNFDHPDYGLMASVSALYYGSQTTQDRRFGVPTSPPRYINTDDGTVVNVSLEKRIFTFNDNNSLSLRLEGNNIFDDKNEAYLDYPNTGRSYYVGLRYEYK